MQSCSSNFRAQENGECRRSPACMAALSCLFIVATASANQVCRGGTSRVADKSNRDLSDARTLLAAGNVEKAEEAARGYLVQNQRSGEAHFLLGLILFRKIQSVALEHQISSRSSDSHNRNEDVTFREENARASLAEYTEGAKYQHPSAMDLKIVALDYVLLGSYADASKWLTSSVKADPQDAEAWYYLGRSRYNENRFEDAIQAFLRSLERKPQDVKAETNLGLCLVGLNRLADAEAAFRKSIEWQSVSAGKEVEPYIDLGDLLIQQNRPKEAVAYLTQAITLAPRESRAREKLGTAYLSLNDLVSARSQLETAVVLDPGDASLHYLLGSVYRRQGDSERARTEFEQFQLLKEANGSKQP